VPVIAIAPRLDARVPGAAAPSNPATAPASATGLVAEIANSGGWADSSSGSADFLRLLRDFFIGTMRPIRGVVRLFDTLLGGFGARLRNVLQGLGAWVPRGNNGPAADPPGPKGRPLPDPPEEEAELPPSEGPTANGVLPKDGEQEAGISLAAVFLVVGAGASWGSVSGGGVQASDTKRPTSEPPTEI
jgi:hypothetical protein